MSINVHVSGNPVKINRGKMVSADLDHCKKEFEKRRLIRLEQVRQQSKNIAEGLRNKVKKEKKLQEKEIEEEGKQKLKNWQNRKLLELQTQYAHAIKELGVAHKEAQKVNEQDDLHAEQERINLEKSQKRGKAAASKLHTDKRKEELDKSRAQERKMLVRDIENNRAQMVVNAPRPKRPKGEISITISNSDEETVSGSNGLSDIEEMEESSSCSCAVSAISEDAQDVSRRRNISVSRPVDDHPPSTVPSLHLVSDESPTGAPPPSPKPPPRRRTYIPPTPLPRKLTQAEYDTRISDRIKQRHILETEPSDTKFPEQVSLPGIENRTDVRDFINTRCYHDCKCCCAQRERIDSVAANQGDFFATGDTTLQNKGVETDPQKASFSGQTKGFHSAQTSANKINESTQKSDGIPFHPPVRIKSFTAEQSREETAKKPGKKAVATSVSRQDPTSTSKTRRETRNVPQESASPTKQRREHLSKRPTSKSPQKMGSTSKVQIYDHPNRFLYEKRVPPGSFVEKIPVESLEFLTEPESEQDHQEDRQRRERDAQIRGRRALERERLERDYQEMLKKLPLLQKKERICEIYNDKPEFHMSEERLKEKERQRQNNLENVYNKLFPNLKPAVVTLPKKTPLEPEERVEEGSVDSLNLAEWDVDYRVPHGFSSEEVQEIIKNFIHNVNPRDRRAKLKELLKNLDVQRDELLKSFASLPRTDTLDELVNDLKSFDDGNGKSKPKPNKHVTRKRSRKENDTDSSIDSSQETSSKETVSNHKQSKSYAGRSPRKKAKTKTRPHVIILQNTSTQTTPKICTKVSEEVQVPEEPAPKIICDKLHIPCDCNKENIEVSDDMCHIYIKLNDNETPEVLVKDKGKEKLSKPVLTKHTTVGTQISPVSKDRVSQTTKVSTAGKRTSRPSGRLEKPTTWRDQLSKNSISTTSTSYFSPPEFRKQRSADRSSFYNLRKQPQPEDSSLVFKTSAGTTKDQLDDPLKSHIHRLLSMQKAAVDNLSVSTSTVETPSQTIVETESNIPKKELQDMVNAFKSAIDNITENLNFTPDAKISSTTKEPSKTTSSKGSMTEKRSSSSNEDLVIKYAQISDTVSKRIKTLAEMIEKLRDEKLQILQLSCSKSCTKSVRDGEFSTSYLDLPESRSSSSSKTISSEEEDILRKLLEIDHNILNRRWESHDQPPKEETVRTNGDATRKQDVTSPNTTHQELVERLQRLKSQKFETPPSPEQQSFVPFLSDIPKLPKFEPQIETTQNHRRPPPSKGLTAAKKFNGNISLVPHELSTIAEGDSQVSTKVPSPDNTEINLNPPLTSIPEIHEPLEMPLVTPIRIAQKSLSKSDSSGGKSLSGSSSNKDDSAKSTLTGGSLIMPSPFTSSLNKSKRTCNDSTCFKQLSSSSSDDLETIESMLRSIGMEWAIPTLHKTQEALALGSSSSSLDLSKKKNDASVSDVSLKDYLLRQVLRKISSSTLLSEASPNSFLGENLELSEIPDSKHTSKQKTSTPLNISKNSSKSKAFTDSDLSSIKFDTSRSARRS